MGLSAEPGGLIGARDVVTPSWALGYEAQVEAGMWAVARTAPRIVGVVGSWAWRASPRLALAAVGVQGAAAVTTAWGLLATADVFTHLLAQGPSTHRLLAALPSVLAVAAAVVGNGVLQAGAGAARAALVPRIDQRAQDDLYTALAEVDLLAFEDPDFTGLLDRASARGLESIQLAAAQIAVLFAALVSILAAVVAAGALHPLLAPLVVVAALPQGWASLRGGHVELATFLRMVCAVRRREVTAQLMTERVHAAEIRAVTAQHTLLAEHRRITAELTSELVRVGQRRNLLLATGRALAGIGALGGYLVLGLLVYTGDLPLALAGTAVVAMRTAAQAIGTGVSSLNDLFELGVHVDLYRSSIAETTARRRTGSTHRLDANPVVIELTGVSFRYPGQSGDALHEIDLTLRAGQVIALVGENGSGKSTLAKLITGLYLPTAGQVCWDGVPTDCVDPVELHRRIAMVLQEPMRWPVTAGTNIRIGRLERTDTDDAAFTEAATRSGADAVLAQLPEGEHTVLSRAFQNGHDLSGGQWQRISVARGLYRDSAVVVADEPTSAMDARAEHAVFTALRSLSEQPNGHRRCPRITVLITHRLANVRDADQIVVLERGRITERGSHEQLMTRDGTYRQLFDLQANPYRG